MILPYRIPCNGGDTPLDILPGQLGWNGINITPLN